MDNKKSKVRNKGLSDTETDSKEQPILIIKSAKTNNNVNGVQIDISSSSKQHNTMSYTTNIATLDLILTNKTLRSSSLNNANLNDPMEKERVDIVEFSGSKFITCFSHENCESVPLWLLYGEKNRPAKVVLQFKNFANSLEDYIHMDYCFIADNKKCFFDSPERKKTFKHNSKQGQQQGLPQINAEFSMSNYIESMTIFDVEYVPLDSKIFYKKNSQNMEISLSSNNTHIIPAFNTIELGKHKSNPWEYEHETRILTTLWNQKLNKWNYIDLRLKDEIFRDLQIILSPWVDDENKNKIVEILDKSKLPNDIKNSITVCHSGLEGKLYFPE